jgi:hypothetical protein
MTISAQTRFPITAGIGETRMKVPFLDLNAHHEPNMSSEACAKVTDAGALV